LGRPKYSDEKFVGMTILRSFPDDPLETITWSELRSKVRKAKDHKVRSKETLARYRKQFLEAGVIVQEGRQYRLSSTIRTWTNWMKKPALEWEGKSIENKQALRELLALQFTFILWSYLEMLDGLIDIQEESKARRYVDSFFRIIPLENQLMLFAAEVWRNRKKVPLKAIEQEATEKGGTLSFSLEVRPSTLFEKWLF
jgi:hypothetical protein